DVPASLTTAVFTTDHAGRVTAWSDQAAALFGRPAAEALGLDWDVLFDPDMSDRLKDALGRAAVGKAYTGVLYTRSGGRLLSLALHCTPLTGVSDQPVLVCSVGDADRERRAATRTAFMDELIRKSPFGLVMIDEDLRFVLVNDSLASINGV